MRPFMRIPSNQADLNVRGIASRYGLSRQARVLGSLGSVSGKYFTLPLVPLRGLPIAFFSADTPPRTNQEIGLFVRVQCGALHGA